MSGFFGVLSKSNYAGSGIVNIKNTAMGLPATGDWKNLLYF